METSRIRPPIVIDHTPPTASGTPVVTNVSSFGTATVSWSASTDNVGVTGYGVYLDYGSSPIVQTTGLSVNLAELAPGSHTVTIKAYDAAGNISASSAPTTFAIFSPLSANNSASANTSIIQAMVDKGGSVRIANDGTNPIYQINASIILSSYTDLTIDAGVEIRVNAANTFNLFTNANASNVGQNISNIAYSETFDANGRRSLFATLNFSATITGNLTKAGFIEVQNTTDRVLNGIYEIKSFTAQSVQIYLAQGGGNQPLNTFSLPSIIDGIFATSGALPAASTNAGKLAFVGSAYPYNLYACNGVSWVATSLTMVGAANTSSPISPIFASSSALQTAYPAASNIGSLAICGSAYPYILYIASSSGWSPANFSNVIPSFYTTTANLQAAFPAAMYAGYLAFVGSTASSYVMVFSNGISWLTSVSMVGSYSAASALQAASPAASNSGSFAYVASVLYISNGTSWNAVKTITGTVCDGKIAIRGAGKLNGNYSSGTIAAQNNIQDHGIVFNNIFEPWIEGDRLSLEDFAQYAVLVCNMQNPYSGKLHIVNNADGVHYLGPCFGFAVIEDITGSTGDDCAIFDNGGSDTVYAPYLPANNGGSWFGGGKMSRIKPEWCGNTGAAIFYPSGGMQDVQSNWWMYGTYTVEDCGVIMPSTGAGQELYPQSGFGLGNGYVPQPGGIDHLRIINQSGNIFIDNNNVASINIGKLTIDGHSTMLFGETGNITIGVNVNDLIIRDSAIFSPGGNGQLSYLVTRGYASINNITIDSPKLTPSAADNITLLGLSKNESGSTIGNVVIINPMADASLGGYSMIINTNSNTCSNTPNIIVNDFIDVGFTNPFTTSAGSFDFTFNGGKCNNALFNFYGSGNITLNGGDLNMIAGKNLFVASNHNNCSFKRWRSGAAKQRVTPTTGNTVSLSALSGEDTLIIAPAGALASLVIAFPTNACDGESRTFTITQAITALSSSGSVIGFPTTAAAGYKRTFVYSAADSAWV